MSPQQLAEFPLKSKASLRAAVLRHESGYANSRLFSRAVTRLAAPLKKRKFSTQECIETKDGGFPAFEKRNGLQSCG